MIRTRSIYTAAIVECLRELDRAAKADEVYGWIIARGMADAVDLRTIQTDGGTRFHKEVRWARKNLYDAQLVSAPEYGVWALTAEGARLTLTPETAGQVVRERIRAIKAGQYLVTEGPADGFDGNYDATSLPGPTNGPTPSDWSGLVSRSANAPTATYLVRFGERDIWKIGQAADVASRLADIKRHVPEEIIEENWVLVKSKTWPTAVKAHQVEQALLASLKKFRTVGERVACTEAQVLTAWEMISSQG